MPSLHCRSRLPSALAALAFTSLLTVPARAWQSVPPTATPCSDAYWVDPAGDDTNAGTQLAPFRTLERAQQEVRADIALGCTQDITVWVGAGAYHLPDGIEFTLADSRSDASVTWSGIPGQARPQLIGSSGPVLNWQYAYSTTGLDGTVPVLMTEWTGAPLRALYAVDGMETVRLEPARSPDKGWARFETVACGTATYPDGLLPALFELEFARVHTWGRENCNPNDFGPANKLRIDKHASADRRFDFIANQNLRPEAPFFVEGSIQLLDRRGEWAHTTIGGTTYLAMVPLTPLFEEVVLAPSTHSVIRVLGEKSDPVRNLHFRSLDVMISESLDHVESFTWSYEDDPDGQLAGVLLEWVDTLSMVDCHLHHVGGDGLRAHDYARNVDIRQNLIEHCGVMGISLYSDKHEGPGQLTFIGDMGDHEISDNIIRSCGEAFAWGGGVILNSCDDTTVIHNTIHDMPRYGIYLREPESTGNAILKNDIHDVMKSSADVAGITVWTVGGGNVLHNNTIHDCFTPASAMAQKIASRGIYIDYLSQGVEVTSNLIYGIETDVTDLDSANIVLKGNDHLVHNNISVLGGEDGVECHIFVRRFSRTGDPLNATCMTVTENILYEHGGAWTPLDPGTPILRHEGSSYVPNSVGVCGLDATLCGSSTDQPVTFTGWGPTHYPWQMSEIQPDMFELCQNYSLHAWRTLMGQSFDVGSILPGEDDPLFEDASQDDYRLKDGAAPLDPGFGFERLDQDVGVQVTQF